MRADACDGGGIMAPWRIWKFVKTAGRDGLLLVFALRDPRTPLPLKAAIVALIAYTLSPFDLLPDFALLVGWADDLAVLMISVPFLASRLPPAVRADAAARVARLLGRLGARRA
jgi:uncharacterized membrane protein YkvA (DUF1232 family)